MERLKKGLIVIGALFTVIGIGFQMMAKTTIWRTESWMEESFPREFGGYRMIVGGEGPNVSYKMDERTYAILNPYGIVARVMSSKAEQYDTVAIMSSKKESFHDPRICFSAQGWLIENEVEMPVESAKYGKINVTLATMVKDKKKSFAVFFYKGPYGFEASTNGIKLQMFKYQMKNLKDAEGIFYRIIPLHTGATKEQLQRYIGEYLDAVHEQSDGML